MSTAPLYCLPGLLLASLSALAQEGAAEPEVRVVTATRRQTLLKKTPGVVQVITRREIEALGPLNTGQLLEFVTGATRETGTGSGHPKRSIIGLNGLPANYTLVLVDGVRLLSEHIHTGQNLELIPPEHIERIEIIRGAAAAQYGTDAIGGVVNLVLRKAGERREGEAYLEGGSHSTFRGGLTWLLPMGERTRLSAFLDREQSEGFPLKAPASRVGQTGYSRENLRLHVERRMGEAGKAFCWGQRVGTTMDWKQGTTRATLVSGALGFHAPLSASLELSGQVAHTRWEAEASKESHELTQPELRLHWQLGDSQSLTWGVDHRATRFARTSVEATPRQDAWGTWLQHEWRPAEGFTLMSALRKEAVEGQNPVHLPMVSMVWSPLNVLRVRASWAEGFHAPTLQELHEKGYGHSGRALRFGNPELRPERSQTVTAGLDWSPHRSWEFMCLAFQSGIRDMIVPVFQGPWEEDPTKDVWRRMNIAEAEVHGCGRIPNLGPLKMLRPG